MNKITGTIGLLIVIAGFLHCCWTIFDPTSVSNPYVQWNHHVKQIPGGAMVKRGDAAFQLSQLAKYYRVRMYNIIYPVSIMFVGSLMIFFSVIVKKRGGEQEFKHSVGEFNIKGKHEVK